MKTDGKIVTSVGYVLASAALCGTIMVPAFAATTTGGSTTTSGKDANSSSSSTNADAASNTASTDSTAMTTSKEETVYVFSKSDGSVKHVEVSDWLKNPDGLNTIRDASTLSDIVNVEGSEGYTGSGSSLAWDAQGNDIYYKGTTSENPPISIKVTYQLDGKTVSADEIAGKSGRVTIRFDYENNARQVAWVNGAATTICTPFAVVTGTILDNDGFKNVQVENGKVINDGDRCIVAGFALPGMQDSLGIGKDKVDIPDYFEITADATDFDLPATLTMATSDLLDDVDASSLDESNLQSSVDKLQSAMSQLMNGSDSLAAGLQQLASGSSQIDAGAQQLASGSSTLADGTSQLAAQTAGLPSSSKQLAEGSSALATGLNDAVSATSRLSAGSTQVSGGLYQLKSGLNAAIAGIGTASDANTLLCASTQLEQGLTALKGNAAAGTGLAYAAAATGSISTGLSGAVTSIGQLSAGAGQVETALGGTSQYLSGAQAQAAKASDALSSIDTTSLSDEHKAAIAEAIASLSGTGGVSADISAANGLTTQASGGMQTVSSGLTALQGNAEAGTGIAGAAAGTANVKSGLDKAVSSIGDASTSGTLLSGAHALNQGLIALKYGNGTATNTGLTGALAALGDSSTENTLIYGSNAVSTGLAALKGDQTSGLVYASNGASQLATGTAQLAASAPQLTSAIQQIHNGAWQLSSGTATLAGNTPTLASGAQSAYEGSVTLSSGLKQFNEEGVQKIVDSFNGDLSGLSDRVSALASAGKDYRNFAGVADGMSAHVKFVYETDAIHKG